MPIYDDAIVAQKTWLKGR